MTDFVIHVAEPDVPFAAVLGEALRHFEIRIPDWALLNAPRDVWHMLVLSDEAIKGSAPEVIGSLEPV